MRTLREDGVPCTQIDEIATVNPTAIMVSYHGAGTGLGAYHEHRPSHHASVFEGINVIR